MSNIKRIIPGLLSLVLAACAHQGNHISWQDFNQSGVQEAQAQQGLLVFYRSGEEKKGSAVNLSIDGQYLSSLLAGGHISTPVCPSTHQITAVPTGKDQAYLNKLKQHGSSLNIQAGQTVYIKIHSDGNNAQLQQIDPQTAQTELAQTRTQAHTLARLSPSISCAH